MPDQYRCFVVVNETDDARTCSITLEVPGLSFFYIVNRDLSQHDAMHHAAKLSDALRQAGTNIGEPRLRKVTE